MVTQDLFSDIPWFIAKQDYTGNGTGVSMLYELEILFVVDDRYVRTGHFLFAGCALVASWAQVTPQ